MIARCIRNSGFVEKLTNNMIYEIENTNEFDTFVSVMLNGRMERGFYANRFEEVTELRVGDIVTIRKDLNTVINPIIEYTEEMKQYQGEKAMIKEVVHSTDTYYHIDNDDEHWAWSIDMFDFNSQIQKKRQITKEIDIFESFNT